MDVAILTVHCSSLRIVAVLRRVKNALHIKAETRVQEPPKRKIRDNISFAATRMDNKVIVRAQSKTQELPDVYCYNPILLSLLCSAISSICRFYIVILKALLPHFYCISEIFIT